MPQRAHYKQVISGSARVAKKGGAQLEALARSALQVGIRADQSPDLVKRIELCNRVSLLGLIIMVFWAVVETYSGDRTNLGWELCLALAFGTGLVLNGAGFIGPAGCCSS